LSEVLARIRDGPVLSRPAPPGLSGKRLALVLAKRAKTLPARAYFAAILSAVLLGIGVNALMLQRERHPAPLFAPAPRQPSSATSALSPAPHPPAVASASIAVSAPATPPARPSELASGFRPSVAEDPISTLLREEARTGSAGLLLAAQTALVKLGYAVESDGNESRATQEALRDFERGHGLPTTTEITPQLVRQVLKAARSEGR
jgi:hypothetical protein